MISSFFLGFVLVAVVVLGVAAPKAHAQSLTGNVGSAGVTRGEQAVETRFGVDDDGNVAARIHYDNAFTDWYQLRIIGSFSRPDGGKVNFSGLTFENWFQWSKEADDQSGFNGGLRLAYTYADQGEPDEVEFRLTATDKFAEHWEWRTNLIGEIEIGDGRADGVALQARGQLTREITLNALGAEDWRFGAEVFSEFGSTENIPRLRDQAHQIGPVVKASWSGGYYLQSAVRFGLTEGSDDAMFKVFVGREF